MRRLVCLLFATTIAFTAMAQLPWEQLSDEVQRAVLSSRRTPEVIREVITEGRQIVNLDTITRTQLLDAVTTKCRDESLAALNIYLYNILRSPDGVMAASDLRMLSFYTSQLLELITLDNGLLVSYAYALGRMKAHGEAKECDRLLRKLRKKRYVEHYGATIASFCRAIDIVYGSEVARTRVFEDITPTVKSERHVLLSSCEEYSAASSVESLVAPLTISHDALEQTVRSECMTWGGGYHTPIEHKLGRAITVIRSACFDAEYITFIDADGISYTLPNDIYSSPSQRLIAVDRLSEHHSIILGCVTSRGAVEIEGRVYADRGREIVGVRFSNEYAYIRALGAAGEEYLKVYIGK